MKKIGIAVGVLAVIGIGVGIYYYNKGKKSKPSGNIPMTATSKDFDEIVDTAKKIKSDWFEGSSPERLKNIRDSYMKNMTTQEHKQLVALMNKPESSYSASEKISLSEFMNKIAKDIKKK